MVSGDHAVHMDLQPPLQQRQVPQFASLNAGEIGFRRGQQFVHVAALEQAALANRRNVTSGDVQLALDTLPWLARARPTG